MSIMLDAIAEMQAALQEHFTPGAGKEASMMACRFLDDATTVTMSLFEGMVCTATIMSEGSIVILCSKSSGFGWEIIKWEEE